MSEWQRIETAPRDGSAILATDDEWLHPYVCWWDMPDSPNGQWMTIARYDFDAHPTHWMPLPEPPK